MVRVQSCVWRTAFFRWFRQTSVNEHGQMCSTRYMTSAEICRRSSQHVPSACAASQQMDCRFRWWPVGGSGLPAHQEGV